MTATRVNVYGASEISRTDYEIHVGKLGSIFCIFGKEVTPKSDVLVPQSDSNAALSQMLRRHSNKALRRPLKYVSIADITPHKMIQPFIWDIEIK